MSAKQKRVQYEMAVCSEDVDVVSFFLMWGKNGKSIFKNDQQIHW